MSATVFDVVARLYVTDVLALDATGVAVEVIFNCEKDVLRVALAILVEAILD